MNWEKACDLRVLTVLGMLSVIQALLSYTGVSEIIFTPEVVHALVERPTATLKNWS